MKIYKIATLMLLALLLTPAASAVELSESNAVLGCNPGKIDTFALCAAGEVIGLAFDARDQAVHTCRVNLAACPL